MRTRGLILLVTAITALGAFTAPPNRAAEATPAPAGKGFLVHVASMKTEAGALREWTRLQSMHPDLLAKLSPTLVTSNVGEKGIYLRLYAGTLPDEASAKAICEALEATKDYCAIVKN